LNLACPTARSAPSDIKIIDSLPHLPELCADFFVARILIVAIN